MKKKDNKGIFLSHVKHESIASWNRRKKV